MLYKTDGDGGQRSCAFFLSILPSPRLRFVVVLAFCFFTDRKRQYPTCYLVFLLLRLFIIESRVISAGLPLFSMEKREEVERGDEKQKVALLFRVSEWKSKKELVPVRPGSYGSSMVEEENVSSFLPSLPLLRFLGREMK